MWPPLSLRIMPAPPLSSNSEKAPSTFSLSQPSGGGFHRLNTDLIILKFLPTHSFGHIWLCYLLVCFCVRVLVLVVCILTMQMPGVFSSGLYPLDAPIESLKFTLYRKRWWFPSLWRTTRGSGLPWMQLRASAIGDHHFSFCDIRRWVLLDAH